MQAVKFARQNELLVSIRGGGHNIAGNAVCDDGLMIDLSLMKNVQVDPNARRATVDPGCLLSDFDAAAQAYGLATPLGINSTTGVAGLTLGGGFGWLSRKYGMTIDNLLSANVILADGKQVRASVPSMGNFPRADRAQQRRYLEPVAEDRRHHHAAKQRLRDPGCRRAEPAVPPAQAR